MFKKIGLPLMALAGGLLFVPHQAKADERFGVYVGAPVYRYPAYPAYVYTAPRYVAPYRAYRAWDRYEDRREHRRDERWEHERREHDGDRRDWR